MAADSNKDPSIFQTALRQLPKPITSLDDVDAHLPTTYNRNRRRFGIVARSLPSTGLSLQDYYPGSVASPVRLEALSNPYFGSLPVITGGESLFPESVLQSRHAYANALDLQAQQEREKLKDSIFAKYAQEKGSPNYQPVLEDFRNTHILGFINDELEKDPDQFLKDWNNGGKTRQELDTRYAMYDAAARATNDMDKNIQTSIQQVAEGKPLDKSSRDLQQAYLSGQITKDKNGNDSILPLLKMNTFMRNWKTLDSYAPLIKDFIKSDVQDSFVHGIDVKMPNGKIKHMDYSRDGDEFLDHITREYTSPEKLKYLTDYLNSQVGLTLSPDYDPKAVAAYLHNSLPDMVKEQLITNAAYHPPAGYGKDQQQQQLALDRYNLIKGKLASGGQIPELNAVPYKNGKVMSVNVAQGTATTSPSGAPFSSYLQQAGEQPQPMLNVSYESEDKYGRKQVYTDQVPLSNNWEDNIQLLNKLFNTNREGTAQFVNPEDIKKFYSTDKDFQQGSQQNAPVQQNNQQPQETKTIGGVTYVKINGQWYTQ